MLHVLSRSEGARLYKEKQEREYQQSYRVQAIRDQKKRERKHTVFRKSILLRLPPHPPHPTPPPPHPHPTRPHPPRKTHPAPEPKAKAHPTPNLAPPGSFVGLKGKIDKPREKMWVDAESKKEVLGQDLIKKKQGNRRACQGDPLISYSNDHPFEEEKQRGVLNR